MRYQAVPKSRGRRRGKYMWRRQENDHTTTHLYPLKCSAGDLGYRISQFSQSMDYLISEAGQSHHAEDLPVHAVDTSSRHTQAYAQTHTSGMTPILS